MKTFSDAAMDAIAAGTAIVTGALEINLRPPPFDWDLVDTVDIDAMVNADPSLANGMSVGITLSGFDPSDVLRLSLPAGETFTAWSYQDGTPGHWVNEFDVIPDGDVNQSFRVSQAGITPSSGVHAGFGYADASSARAAFGRHTISGASTYTFWIFDDDFNNTDGVSVRVEKRVYAGGGTLPDPVRVWGGYGPLVLNGFTYQGIGDRALAQQSAGAIGGFAQGLTLSLSGIEPAALELLDADEVKSASVVLYRLVFAADGKTLLDAQVFDRGRADTVDSDEIIGGTATVKLAVESAARGLGSSGARQRSDADQRLINPTDGYFKNTAFAGQKTLYWGGRKPNRIAGSSSSSPTSPTAPSGSSGGFPLA